MASLRHLDRVKFSWCESHLTQVHCIGAEWRRADYITWVPPRKPGAYPHTPMRIVLPQTSLEKHIDTFGICMWIGAWLVLLTPFYQRSISHSQRWPTDGGGSTLHCVLCNNWPWRNTFEKCQCLQGQANSRINTPEALHCYAYHLIGAVGRTGRGLNRDITVNLFGHGEVGYIRQLKPEELISQGR